MGVMSVETILGAAEGSYVWAKTGSFDAGNHFMAESVGMGISGAVGCFALPH